MFNLKEKAMRFTSKAGRKIVKHAPEIMFGAGCVAFVGTIYFAVKATPKINKVLEEHNKEVEEARKYAADPEVTDYDETDLKHDIRVYYRDTFFRVVRIAALPVACGVATLGLFGGAQFIVMRRLGVMAAEYTVLQTNFDNYRARVRADQGVDADYKYLFDEKEEVVKVPVLDEEGNVEEKEEKTTTHAAIPGSYIWTKETSPLCVGVKSTDEMMIEAKINMLKRKFENTHFISEADVLGPDGLHMPKALAEKKDAWMFGRVWDDENPENNVLKFVIESGHLPDYEKGAGNRDIYTIVWENKENLYNKI